LDIAAWIHPDFGFKWVFKDLKETLAQELDFLNEGRNSERCAKELKHLSYIYVPKVYWDFSTKRVLTAEFIDGCKINDVAAIQAQGLTLKDVDAKLIRVFGEQIFHTGFVHGDPHPGNIFVRKAKNGKSQLVLLDHGLYEFLPSQIRKSLCNLWKSIILNDAKDMEKYSKQLNVTDYKLFCEILLQRPLDRPHFRLPNRLTDKDFEYMKKMAQQQFDKIMLAIRSMPKPMLLVFRNMNTVRAISQEHNHPIDRHVLMARISTRWAFVDPGAGIVCKIRGGFQQYLFDLKLRLASLKMQLLRSFFTFLTYLGRAPDMTAFTDQLR